MGRMVKHATTNELNELMDTLLDLHSLSENQTDMLRSVMDELTERGELPEISPEDTKAAYQRFRQRIEENGAERGAVCEAFTDEQKDSENPILHPEPVRGTKPRFFRAAVAAVLVAAGIFVINAAALAATGYNLLGAVAQWTQDAVYSVFGKRNEENTPHEVYPSYMFLKETLDNLEIMTELPKTIPEGYVFSHFEPEEPTDFSPVYAWFFRGDDEFSIRLKRLAVTASYSETSDGGQAEVYKGRYLIASNNGRMKAIWYDGLYEIKIQGDLTYDELTQILDSIGK